MWWFLVRTLIAGLTIAAVSEIAQRAPRIGALILSLPIISIIAFIMTWVQGKDLVMISRLSRETLALVPLSLTLFVPLALCEKLNISFWPAILLGIILNILAIFLWMWLGPSKI